MELGLKGKVAIVTGATSGLGRVVSYTFAGEGTNVVVVGRNEERGNKVVGECQARGVEAIFAKAEVGKFEDVERAVKAALDKFGKVDIAVHSAAPFMATGGYIKRFLEQPPEVSDEFIRTIQYGLMHLVRAVVPSMIQQRSGSIIGIGSDAGRVGDAYQPIYSAAKAAVVALTKSFALDYGPSGIRVNCVSPALFETEEDLPMLIENYGYGTEDGKKKLGRAYALRRLGTAQEVANIVVFLASDAASDVTGQTLSVSGGYSTVS